ncbi:MAG TPA: DUF1015 domain-containing protein, partial [Candidatus Polarisedimenticolia bacterium]|nr:DUF1015 domain-containing protein [Candidatus Polarisedimenticolia bacterium]
MIPFRGLLYSAARIPDLTQVVAPPYDVISAEKAAQLRARDPHNIVHIDLPEGEGASRYARAASLLSQWSDDGVLARDATPALYACSHRYAVRGMPERTRWGILALVRIEEDGSGIILPHERVMDSPRRDRLELTAAARTQLSPIFFFYSDPEGAISATLEATTNRPADRWASPDGVGDVRLWRLGDPDVVGRICGSFAGRKLWIADGHHRYAAARELRDRWRAESASGGDGERSYDYVLAYL